MSGVLTSKADITLQREADGGSLGFTLRGGSNIDQPLLVTNVRSGGPADRWVFMIIILIYTSKELNRSNEFSKFVYLYVL